MEYFRKGAQAAQSAAKELRNQIKEVRPHPKRLRKVTCPLSQPRLSHARPAMSLYCSAPSLVAHAPLPDPTKRTGCHHLSETCKAAGGEMVAAGISRLGFSWRCLMEGGLAVWSQREDVQEHAAALALER